MQQGDSVDICRLGILVKSTRHFTKKKVPKLDAKNQLQQGGNFSFPELQTKAKTHEIAESKHNLIQ